MREQSRGVGLVKRRHSWGTHHPTTGAVRTGLRALGCRAGWVTGCRCMAYPGSGAAHECPRAPPWGGGPALDGRSQSPSCSGVIKGEKWKQAVQHHPGAGNQSLQRLGTAKSILTTQVFLSEPGSICDFPLHGGGWCVVARRRLKIIIHKHLCDLTRIMFATHVNFSIHQPVVKFTTCQTHFSDVDAIFNRHKISL